MDFEVVVTFGGILVSGVTLGLLLSVAGPRDDEAAAMHRRLARRGLAWLPGRFRNHGRLEPRPSSR